MSATIERRISQVLTANESEILAEWLKRQKEEGRTRYDEAEAREKSTHFLKLFAAALEHGNIESPGGPHWQDIFDMLADLSRSRAQLGFSPSETAIFIFSLKQPLFDRLRREFGNDAQGACRCRVVGDEPARQARPLHHRDAPEAPRGSDRAPAAGIAGALDAGRRIVGRHSRAPAHRHARQRAHAGRHGKPARAHRRDLGQDRDHRNHRRAHRGHARRAAPAEDRRGCAADGRRLHHQRHPSPDRADDRASRRRPQLCRHQGDARRCLPRRAAAQQAHA